MRKSVLELHLISFLEPGPIQLIIQFLQEAENEIAANGPSTDQQQLSSGNSQSPLQTPGLPVGNAQSTSPQPMDIDLRVIDPPAVDLKSEKPSKFYDLVIYFLFMNFLVHVLLKFILMHNGKVK